MSNDVNPPQVQHGAPPAPKTGMPTWVIVLIVVGALFLFVIPACVATVAIVVPKMQETKRRTVCMSNLQALGEVFLTERMGDPKRKLRSGPALFLEWRSTTSEIKRGNEKALICPGDVLARLPETEDDKKAWDRVDLDHAPRNLCSYAVRDFARFPLAPNAPDKAPIAACLNHKGGAVVLFDAGDVQFVPFEELGVQSHDEMTVGPDSKSPLLRVLRYGDGSVR
jgi:hypothetical protein